jgi:hypothetical protein
LNAISYLRGEAEIRRKDASSVIKSTKCHDELDLFADTLGLVSPVDSIHGAAEIHRARPAGCQDRRP